MNVMSLMKELEHYSLFNDVSGKGGTLEIRDRPGDLATLGVISIPYPIVNSEFMDCPVVIEVKGPCPTHEPVNLEEYEKKLDELFQAYRRHAAAEKARGDQLAVERPAPPEAPRPQRFDQGNGS